MYTGLKSFLLLLDSGASVSIVKADVAGSLKINGNQKVSVKGIVESPFMTLSSVSLRLTPSTVLGNRVRRVAT